MSKRAPELVKLGKFGPRRAWVEAKMAEAAIRSQRVKLHRERAMVHRLKARLTAARYAPWAAERLVRRHEKAAARFSSRADKIERGEL